MIEQIGVAIRFFAFFVDTKVGATGLTVTVDVYAPDGSVLVNDAAATEIGGGLYRYELASGSVTVEGEYTAVFATADAGVDQQHIPSIFSVGRAGIENLDAAVSTRSTFAANGNVTVNAYAAGLSPAEQAPTVDEIADQVWDEALAGHAGAGSTGEALTNAAAEGGGATAQEVWEYATRTLTADGGPNAAAIADAVWDEALAGHASAGSAGAAQTAAAAISPATPTEIWEHGTRTLTDKADYGLSSAAIDAILDDVIEGTVTVRQALRGIMSVLFGESSGGGTGEITFVGIDGVTDRVIMTIGEGDDRTAVTLDLT